MVPLDGWHPDILGMRKGIKIEVAAADRARLEVVVADRNSPQKHAWRARIVLTMAEGVGTAEAMRRAGKSKPCVRRWQERFAAEGVAGLLRDKARPSRIPPLTQATIDRVVALTATDPPHEATHWTGRPPPWPRRSGSAPARCRGSGARTSSARTGSA